MKYSNRYSSILLSVFLINCIGIAPTYSAFPRIFCSSMPKSGTHLLNNAIKLLTQLKPHPSYGFSIHSPEKFAAVIRALQPSQFLLTHLPYTKEMGHILTENNFRNFLMIRDPRDQIVSQAYWVQTHPKVWPHAVGMPTNDIILSIISDGVVFKNPCYRSYTDHKAFLDWQQVPSFCTVKFEHLVGPQGGGSKKLQHQEIAKIAAHIHLKVNKQIIEHVAAHIFGNSLSFRKGKIGSWKNIFTPQHFRAFQQNTKLMQLLIDLKYEKDPTWIVPYLT